MRKYSIIAGVIIIILILGLIYYQSHISITGFNIQKNELIDVIIYTEENQYMVTDATQILDISKEVSKMNKYAKIEASNYHSSKKQHSKFTEILIQTKSKGTIGGSFWDVGNNVLLDSNGYYWVVNNDLFDLMEKSLKDAKKLH